MKIICFIAALIEITKEVHTLTCHVNEQDKEPKATLCVDPNISAYLCGHIKRGNNITRECIPKEIEDKVACRKKIMKREIVLSYCLCDFDNCNHNCTAKEASCNRTYEDNVNDIKFEDCEAQCNAPPDGPSTNDIKLTEDTNIDPNATEAAVTTSKGPNPTKDSAAGNNDTDDSQPTGDITEGTEKPAEETQKSTRKAATNNGNQRLAQSNPIIFAIWILVTLVIRSFY